MNSRSTLTLPIGKWSPAVVLVVGILGLEAPAQASAFFLDDFEDGSATDGNPVSWNTSYGPFVHGSRTVIAGSYVLAPDASRPVEPGYWENDSVAAGPAFQDLSISTRARLLSGANLTQIGLEARDTYSGSPDGRTGHQVFAWLSSDGEVGMGTSNNTVTGPLKFAQTALDPFKYDVMLRLDAIGEMVQFWTWPADGSQPATPQLTMTLPGVSPTLYNVPGNVGVWNGQVGVNDSGSVVPVAFRYVQVVPEPGPWGAAVLVTAFARATRHRRRRHPRGS